MRIISFQEESEMGRHRKLLEYALSHFIDIKVRSFWEISDTPKKIMKWRYETARYFYLSSYYALKDAGYDDALKNAGYGDASVDKILRFGECFKNRTISIEKSGLSRTEEGGKPIKPLIEIDKAICDFIIGEIEYRYQNGELIRLGYLDGYYNTISFEEGSSLIEELRKPLKYKE